MESNNPENKPVEIEDNYPYITYLIGAMEKTAEKDDGSAKREDVERELLLRNVYPINPVKLEAFKTNMSVEESKEKMIGWIASGNRELLKEKSVAIWFGIDYVAENGQLIHIPGDFDYVRMSDWITLVINRGDKPCGSFGESAYGAILGKPLYIISEMPKKELPKSLFQWMCIVDGEHFENLSQYLKYIDEQYKLKRKEEK